MIQIDKSTGHMLGVAANIQFVALGISFFFLLVPILFVVRFLHKRPLLSLITASNSLNFSSILCGFSGCLFALMACHLVGALLFPASYRVSFSPSTFLQFLPLVVIFTPVQTLAEEVFFRGYLLQATSSLVKNSLCLALLNGCFFAAAHLGNPGAQEIPLIMLYYVIFGFLLALVTMRTNSLETAFGAHLANNVFCWTIVNYVEFAMPTSSFFECTKTRPLFEIVTLFVIAVAVLFCRKRLAQSPT